MPQEIVTHISNPTFMSFSSDCPDGEDEKNCESSQCQDWQFGCADGQCIFQTWKCDGDNDCADGSDEANCTEVADGGLEKPVFPIPTFPKGKTFLGL